MVRQRSEVVQSTTSAIEAPPQSGEIVPHPDRDNKIDFVQRTEKELDDAVATYRAHERQGATAYWQMAQVVAHIQGNDLWKLRTQKTESGKERPRWSSWEAFCSDELRLGARYTKQLLDLASHYSEAQVKEIGTTKLLKVLSAPASSRAELLADASAGATVRDLVKKVQKKNDEAGIKPKKPRKTVAAKHDEEEVTQKVKKSKTITVASVLGSANVKLWKKPASLKAFDEKSASPARRIADDPYGVVELDNGVCEHFYITESPSGQLILKIVRKREEA
jgi:hypothetical protein